jgi:hypothetical protein
MKVYKKDTEGLNRLPHWVKCTKCGGKPTETDYLIELIPHSTALIHQSCSFKMDKIAGFDGFGLSKGE